MFIDETELRTTTPLLSSVHSATYFFYKKKKSFHFCCLFVFHSIKKKLKKGKFFGYFLG